ncbi:MAG TPA: hypothetical protein VGO47_09615 [Chlamydiales bacterium]|nr:hypothetical protein [Chlamydiales bacterium]
MDLLEVDRDLSLYGPCQFKALLGDGIFQDFIILLAFEFGEFPPVCDMENLII